MQIKNLFILDYTRIQFLIKIILILTILFSCFKFISREINFITFINITFLFSINLFLFYIFFSSKKELSYIQIYPLVIFYFFFTYSFYFYLSVDLQNKILPLGYWGYENIPSMNLAIRLVYLGLIFFSIGYFLPNLFKDIKIKKIDLNKLEKYGFLLVIFFILLVIFIYINNVEKIISSSVLSQLKEPLVLFSICYLQIRYLHNKNFYLLILSGLLFISIFFIEISFGATVFPFMIVAIILLVSFYKNKNINLLSIIFILISIYILHTLKYDIRSKTWLKYGNVSLFEGEKILNPEVIKNGNLIYNNVSETIKIFNEKLIENTSTDYFVSENNRINQFRRLFHSIITLHIASNKTPEPIKYFDGKSYNGLIYKFIPRIFYKDKPVEEWGNFWGKKYKVLHPRDNQTSWNFPVLSEFYANFGYNGVIFGMLLLGLLIKLILIFINLFVLSPIILSVGSVILLNFFFLESNLSLIIGKTMNQLLFFILIIFGMIVFNLLVERIKLK